MLTRQYASCAIQYKIDRLAQFTNYMKTILVYRELSVKSTGKLHEYYSKQLWDCYRAIEDLKKEIDFREVVDADEDV